MTRRMMEVWTTTVQNLLGHTPGRSDPGGASITGMINLKITIPCIDYIDGSHVALLFHL